MDLKMIFYGTIIYTMSCLRFRKPIILCLDGAYRTISLISKRENAIRQDWKKYPTTHMIMSKCQIPLPKPIYTTTSKIIGKGDINKILEWYCDYFKKDIEVVKSLYLSFPYYTINRIISDCAELDEKMCHLKYE
jgi:hypothetical protein